MTAEPFDRLAASGRADGAAAWLDTDRTGRRLVLRAGGSWTLAHAPALDQRLRAEAARAGSGDVLIDLSAIRSLDTTGAWLIRRTAGDLGERGAAVEVAGLSEELAGLLDRVGQKPEPMDIEGPAVNKLVEIANRVGYASFEFCRSAANLTAFLGMLVVKTASAFLHPGRLRLRSLVYHMEQTGLNAMPIVGLLSFLIGVVLAYQGAIQLRQFGAEVFTVNLLGVSMLRVLGVLLTAIIIAGRSGSAFTAQIGTMKVNQEVDAMRTIGLDPTEVLVLPRLFALLITLPLLSFYAVIMGLVGGAIMCALVLDISFYQFINQLRGAITTNDLLVGIIQAPVFAFIIAMVGCYEGLQVSGSAESVGQQTTRSVVESIFIVIILTALFTIIFSNLGI